VLAATLAVTAVVELTTGWRGLAGGAPVVVALFTVAELRERWVAVAVLVPTATLLQVWAISSPPVGIVAVGPRRLPARPAAATRRRSRSAPPTWSASASSWTGIARRRGARRSPASCTTSWPTRSRSCCSASGVPATSCARPRTPRTTPLRRVELTAEQSVGELRRILAVLRDPDRDPPADVRPAPVARRARRAGRGVPRRRPAGPAGGEGDRRRLPDGVELSVYRIVEEALTNVLRHTRASAVAVRLRYGADTLEVRVDDDGEPRHPGDADPGRAGGHGILGMRERVAALGGELTADVRPGGGFRVGASVPAGAAP
jgi:hypothetical protein